MDYAGDRLKDFGLLGVLRNPISQPQLFYKYNAGGRRRTGISVNPACSSPNALICGARAVRFASHKSRSAFAAKRHKEEVDKADTTYEIAFMRGDGVGDSGS